MKAVRDDLGFTLIEILVALGIFGVVMAVIIGVFISSNRSYLIQEEVVEMQETGRFLTEYLARRIRHAAYDPRDANDPDPVFLFMVDAQTFPTVNYGNVNVSTGTIDYNGAGGANDVMVAFTFDDNEDGVLNNNPGTDWNPDEMVAIVYDVDDQDVKVLDPDAAGGGSPWESLVDNVTAFFVTYYYQNGQNSVAIGLPSDTDGNFDNDAEDIRAIEIDLTVQQRNALFGQPRRTRDYKTRARCRNLGL